MVMAGGEGRQILANSMFHFSSRRTIETNTRVPPGIGISRYEDVFRTASAVSSASFLTVV